jgi:hypothetical protein
MKRLFIVNYITLVYLLLMPIGVHAQAEQGVGGIPPIAQPLIREGDLAVSLVSALKLGTATSEVEAENMLAKVAILPRNGWIADYPVTPDIVGELRQSIGDAADSKSLTMGKTEALQAFQDVMAGSDLAVRGGTPGQAPPPAPSGENYPSSAEINSYYSDQGPPVVTYYPPPPDYLYLYTWVPYPFWGWGFGFSGYYVLGDFHRVTHVNHRVEVVSNHYVDYNRNRAYRIDPLRRFQGRTYAGIGAPHDAKRFIYPGDSGGAKTIFRGARERAKVEGRGPYSKPARHGGQVHPPHGGKIPSHEGR